MVEFPAFGERKAKNQMGQIGKKAVVRDLSAVGPTYKAFDLMLCEPKFLGFMGKISSIDKLLYDPEYIGGGTHENLDGQYLDLHVNISYHPSRLWLRRLNLILFLNPEWPEDWGVVSSFTKIRGIPLSEAHLWKSRRSRIERCCSKRPRHQRPDQE